MNSSSQFLYSELKLVGVLLGNDSRGKVEDLFLGWGSWNVGWPTNDARRYREVPVEIQVCTLTQCRHRHSRCMLS